ncbi:DUF3108 domain-containing protein [Kiritimatiellota bacterium B12222]|nr:DUF3108 domain-containing protein [Kiritimatiellota bacterium B12222]
MMSFRVLFFLSLLGASVYGQELYSALVPFPSSAPPPPPPPSATELALPFPIGETLTYSIYWGVIGVGESVATTEWEWIHDQWLIRIQFRTQSNGVLAKLYPVDDTIKAYVDPETLLPVQFLMDINEGGKTRNSETLFNWQRKEAYYTKFHDDKEDEVVTIDLKEGTRDLVSFMYFMRETAFEDQQNYEFEVLSDDKIYELEVATDGYDKVKLDEYGKTKSLKLLPEASFEGVFIRKGKMELWLSAKQPQFLTKLVLDTPFANVKLLLKKVTGPQADAWEKEQE